MTTKERSVSRCPWLQKSGERNVCWSANHDIEEATRIKYCEGDWQECEICASADSDDSCD